MKQEPNRTRPGALVGAGLADMATACRVARTRIDIATPYCRPRSPVISCARAMRETPATGGSLQRLTHPPLKEAT